MKKRAWWVLGTTLIVILAILIGVQYIYYSRIAELRREQTRLLARSALVEVGNAVEMRELVRYIQQQMRSSEGDNSPLMTRLREVNDLSQEHTRSIIDTIPLSQTGAAAEEVARIDHAVAIDTTALSDEMLKAFFVHRAQLDQYVLKNLYRAYEYDGMPQLINPRFLQDQMRYRLEQKGVHHPYSIALYDASGRMLHTYNRPGMLRKEYPEANKLVYKLFSRIEHPDRKTPYLLLTLDLDDAYLTQIEPLLPGAISTIIVMALSIIAVMILLRQEAFQRHKSDFINNMTHELKTPVSSISLASEMLRGEIESTDPSKRKRMLSIIDQETSRLSKLIDKVLQVALFEERRQELPLKELEVHELLLDVAEVFSVQIESRGGTLHIGLDAEETWIRANATHMTNILHNLLENAVKYNDPSRPSVIGIYTFNEADQVVIRIEDNGIGIPQESLRHIFDRYYRVPRGYRHDVKGFGIGLAYVYAVIKHFGGRITAERREGGGTAMNIRLPYIGAGEME